MNKAKISKSRVLDSRAYLGGIAPVCSVAKRTLSVREIVGLIPGPVKLAQFRHRIEVVLPRR